MERMVGWTIVGLLLLTVACGGATDANDPTTVIQTNPEQTTQGRVGANAAPGPQRRDVRVECSDELDRLAGCGQATAEERQTLQGMLCESTELTEGQIATVVGCLAQWECGGALPACLGDENPPPQCTNNEDCAEDLECDAGVCQPTETVDCLEVRYTSGTIGDGTEQGHPGQSCFFPGDCLSNRCLSASGSGDNDRKWCANSGDCRNPNNADEECPSGYVCEQVLRETFDDNPWWLCVPGNVESCG